MSLCASCANFRSSARANWQSVQEFRNPRSPPLRMVASIWALSGQKCSPAHCNAIHRCWCFQVGRSRSSWRHSGPLPVRSTPPDQQACRVAVEDRSAGFAHATESGALTSAFAMPKQRTTHTRARARSAEQPRTPGAFANVSSVAPAPRIQPSAIQRHQPPKTERHSRLRSQCGCQISPTMSPCNTSP